MRNRSNSGVRLDYFQRLINKTILKFQNPITGLFGTTEHDSHAWVRDNVYTIMAVWGIALAYRKNADLDEDLAKAYELEQSVVKLMRGLLRCMMLQVDKLEKFKKTQSTKDCLHAKYSSQTGKTVVGDSEWGHLQIDATSLFILYLAQMTAAGLQIIYTLDEVAFVQNLVFYIETAYRTPDYGVWERGDKTNHGLPELNSSSIGMAKAALEAINEVDLFGARGGPASVIHALPDEAQQCQAILHSMLPRESNSKEIDAALISVISFPAFAVDDIEIIKKTRQEIEDKLMGNYGCRRFLRDGYKTAREDPNRLHYEPWELLAFEKIENQWPMFYAFFILDGLYRGDTESVEKYKALLDPVITRTDDGNLYMPEMYSVPKDKVDMEIRSRDSQKRERTGKMLHLWGQSLFILGRLIDEKFISPGELDPLNRRLITEPRPDVVVQVVVIAEDIMMQSLMAEQGIAVQTVSQVAPIQIYPARVLSQIYSLLGKNKSMGLTGRPSSEIGLLATSKLYILQDQILAFIPQFIDQHQFYLALDIDFLVDTMKNTMEDLARNWRMMGRPTFVCTINTSMLDHNQKLPSSLVGTIKKLQSGYIAGTRVHLGDMGDFVSTSCITKLSFVNTDTQYAGQDSQISDFLGDVLKKACPRPRLLSLGKKASRSYRHSSIRGIVRRSRSIAVNAEDIPADKDILRLPRALSYEETALSFALRKLEKGDFFDEDLETTLPRINTSEELAHPHLKGNGRSPMCTPNRSPVQSPMGSPKAQHRLWPFMDKFNNDSSYNNVDVHELVDQLSQSENLNEQADIIHYLYIKQGPNWDTEVDGKSCTVRELLVELYEKAGHWKQWWLVRHAAGMLKKRVEDLALAATDLLVRQKQLSVGLPPDREKIITGPLPPDELAAIIYESCGDDLSTASLTQEILIYLAMFIRTEPKLFKEMLRMRVGLIIQVMASEMSRLFKCSGEDASDHLLNLSPYELKMMLHHILSGKEFVITTEKVSCDSEVMNEYDDEYKFSVVSKQSRQETSAFASKLSRKGPLNQKMPSVTVQSPPSAAGKPEIEDEMEDRQGQWLRRRRLDGALNRVPVGFYTQVWKVLEKCHGLSIGSHFLPHSLTREMTSGEFKFALQVERVLNMIPQPEYRQLMVEALMVTTLLVEGDCRINLSGQVLNVDKIVQQANSIFIKEQNISSEVVNHSTGSAGICLHLYDTAPSGRYGTMSYLARALAVFMNIGDHQNLECNIS
ncbi:phosphorylase b kinase regulatory subunit alpha, liver isoform-like isoform X7 [Dreissena polymorpha]|uniref:phosphorylase b kinase regulatory subunit alpha, liver isoform-like isoform X7 n=1 Tax=Dreissena polymorpha TaxID=45954 RepID=UPI0022642981|nr:phosphorylase b kinase regulatory subunit alpha, liver isoform-like isoform X7 [Dreissena polymorpha]